MLESLPVSKWTAYNGKSGLMSTKGNYLVFDSSVGTPATSMGWQGAKYMKVAADYYNRICSWDVLMHEYENKTGRNMFVFLFNICYQIISL